MPHVVPEIPLAQPQGGLVPLVERPETGVSAPQGFGSLLAQMIEDARRHDVEAQQRIEAFAQAEEPGRIHEIMVAVAKAEIALRTVVSVRNKLLEAYRDLQHMTA
ncbi:MAG: flagellar hook-basal body complex protein FliE [Myxococcota bacterium]|nr:flagellar hook-basal body complex protein FliE [Myxococcota bacterium]